jgi:hypothetical protein
LSQNKLSKVRNYINELLNLESLHLNISQLHIVPILNKPHLFSVSAAGVDYLPTKASVNLDKRFVQEISIETLHDFFPAHKLTSDATRKQ